MVLAKGPYMLDVTVRTLCLLFLMAIVSGCGGSSSGPVEIAPMTQTPTSEFPVGKEPELLEAGP